MRKFLLNDALILKKYFEIMVEIISLKSKKYFEIIKGGFFLEDISWKLVSFLF